MRGKHCSSFRKPAARILGGFMLVTALALACWGSQALAGEKILMMATTTSTDNTGLLDYLAPHFLHDTGIELRWVAVGTGKALKLGQNCDVDVLLVHAPAAEKTFVAEGYGTDRREIMYNDFVVIGPAKNPAGIAGTDVRKAFREIRAQKALFLSRGDESGTNKKERQVWEANGLTVPEKEPWYLESGQGMLATITIAAEKAGYTLTDRGTYIKYETDMNGPPPLRILVEGDPILRNQYSIIAVNPKHCGDTHYDLATACIEWFTGTKAQKLIEEFTLMGKTLFIPNATKE